VATNTHKFELESHEEESAKTLGRRKSCPAITPYCKVACTTPNQTLRTLYMNHQNNTFSESGFGGDRILRPHSICGGERGGELTRMISRSRHCQHQRQGMFLPSLCVAHQAYRKEFDRKMSWSSIIYFSRKQICPHRLAAKLISAMIFPQRCCEVAQRPNWAHSETYQGQVRYMK